MLMKLKCPDSAQYKGTNIVYMFCSKQDMLMCRTSADLTDNKPVSAPLMS